MCQARSWAPGTQRWTGRTSLLSWWFVSCFFLSLHSFILRITEWLLRARHWVGYWECKNTNVSLLKGKQTNDSTFTFTLWLRCLRVLCIHTWCTLEEGAEGKGIPPALRQYTVNSGEEKPLHFTYRSTYRCLSFSVFDHLYLRLQVSLYSQQNTWCSSAE